MTVLSGLALWGRTGGQGLYNRDAAVSDTVASSKQEALEEVTIYGKAKEHSDTRAVSTLTQALILQRAGQHLAQILTESSGVRQLQTGATIAQPVLHGLYGNRVLLMNNGVRQEGQQWGVDHAPAIDPNMAQQIKVIKGAEAVRYGADALGGVIEVLPGALPYHKTFSGSVYGGFEVNGRKIFTGARMEGHVRRLPDWAWRLQFSTQKSGDLNTARYYLNNTGGQEFDFSAATGIRRQAYAIEIYYSRFSAERAIFYGAHTGSLADLSDRLRAGKPLAAFDFSYSIHAPKQAVTHDLFTLKGSWHMPWGGQLKGQYAFQYNRRREFTVRRADRTTIPVLNLHLSTHTIDLFWIRSYRQFWHTQIGGSYLAQRNVNQPGTGIVPIIPNFSSDNLGLYAIQKYVRSRYSIEAGLRGDVKNLVADGYNREGRRYGGRHYFRNITYNAGVSVALMRYFYWKSNIGAAWRAPQVNELYSKGLHHGEGTFDEGAPYLVSERGVKWINTLELRHPRLEVTVDIYLQRIGNYIYKRPTGKIRTLFSGAYPIYVYHQSDAFFRGADLTVRYKFWKGWRYEVQASAVWATDIRHKAYFPFIPPPQLRHQLGWKKTFSGIWQQIAVVVGHTFVARQTRYTLANELPLEEAFFLNNGVAVTPAAYHLWHGEVQLYWRFKGHDLRLYSGMENIFNALYKEYTNRFRYYAHDMGRQTFVKIIYQF